MRLLFDQNISFRILKRIERDFPESSQVRALGLENKSDRDIWHYAKVNSFAIVTFDADFYDITVLQGHPPKIIWIRAGNTTTSFLAKLLSKNKDVIDKFLTSADWADVSCLELV